MNPFRTSYEKLILALHHQGQKVNVGEWQAQQGTEFDRTIECQDVEFTYDTPELITTLQQEVKPNLPWAEEHFLERVQGEPFNPPPSHKIWPFAKQSNEEHLDGQIFSHTYPERFWPQFANVGGTTAEGRQIFVPHVGIRFAYGDFEDLFQLLYKRPNTRQAFLPIWFPEDLTAANQGQRVPCTLGYHFMIRGDRLSCRYFMRSCDLFRHFSDDVYMACRLIQFLVDQLNQEWVMDAGGHHEGARPMLRPGHLKMYISSLHIFQSEEGLLTQKALELKRGSLEGNWY